MIILVLYLMALHVMDAAPEMADQCSLIFRQFPGISWAHGRSDPSEMAAAELGEAPSE